MILKNVNSYLLIIYIVIGRANRQTIMHFCIWSINLERIEHSIPYYQYTPVILVYTELVATYKKAHIYYIYVTYIS